MIEPGTCDIGTTGGSVPELVRTTPESRDRVMADLMRRLMRHPEGVSIRSEFTHVGDSGRFTLLIGDRRLSLSREEYFNLQAEGLAIRQEGSQAAWETSVEAWRDLDLLRGTPVMSWHSAPPPFDPRRPPPFSSTEVSDEVWGDDGDDD